MRPQATNRSCSTLSILTGLLCLTLLAPTACKRQTPQQGAATGTPSPPDSTPSVFEDPDPITTPDPQRLVGLGWDIPDGWESYDDFKAYRLATWRVSGDNKGVIAFAYYMGPEARGSVESSAIRWSLQVYNDDRSTSVPEIETREQGALTISTIRLNGNRVIGMTQNELEIGTAGGSLIGAVIEGGPAGRVYFRLSGPKTRVDELLPEFEQLIGSMRVIEGDNAP